MLEIKDLHANVEGKEILKGIDLKVEAGQVSALKEIAVGFKCVKQSAFGRAAAGRTART